VVPARGGSKGIPGKNLRTVGGLSLVAHVAKLCRNVSWIDHAVISTDDENIAAEAVAHGLDAPFRRPAELAHDNASSIDAWQHAWSMCEKINQNRYDIGLLLEPTSPLRCPDDIEQCLSALDDPANAAAATVSKTPGHYTPHKTLTCEASGQISYYVPNGSQYANRHQIPAYYHRNGLCYAVRRHTLLEEGRILEDRCAAIVTERPVVNIDEPLDLEIAELLFRRQFHELAA
jgi:CMP-N,N'-diacetyllegionaminic acid synthase